MGSRSPSPSPTRRGATPMRDIKSLLVPTFGAATATMGALSPLTVIQIVGLCIGALCGLISLVQGAVQAVAALRRHLRRETTAEEAAEELEAIKNNLEKGAKK